MNSKTDIVVDAFNNMRQTANQQWKMMEIGFQNLLVVIGLQLLPVLQNVYHGIYLVTNGLIKWLQNTANMTAFKYALLGIAIVVATILTPAIIGLGVAFVTNPILWSMMAIVGAGILLGRVLQSHPEIIKKVQQAFAAIVPVLGHIKDGVVAVVGKFVQFAQWVRGNEVAFTAFKAILLAIAIAIGINLVGMIVSAIPIIIGYAAAWGAAAIATIAATWPIVALVAAIALVVFGIMELVQHWTQVKALFANIAAAVGSFFSWLGTTTHGALGAVGSFFQATFGKIGQIIDWFSKLTPQKIGYGIGYALGWLVKLHIEGYKLIIGFVSKVIGLLVHLAQAAPGFILHMAIAIMTWLMWLKDQAIIHVVAFAVGIATELVKLWHEAPGFILKMALAIVAWLLWLKTAAWNKIKEVTGAIWTEIQKLPGQAVQVVKDFIAGLVNGIKNGVGAVVDALKHLAGGMIDGFKNALGIHSPSTVMFQHGVNLIQGLINGFQSLDVTSAWLRHTSVLTQPISASFAATGEGRIPGGGYGGGFRIPQGGGTHSPTYNITINAPTAHAPELAKAIRQEMDQRERDNWRRGKRAGFGGGLHAGISGTEVD